MSEPATIVLIDDEPALVELVARYLRREGFRVHAATDGASGLDVIARTDPDVVVLDLMLPEIDGLEVARRIRQDRDPYIIMLTARASEIDRVVGLRVGADDYVTKPFSPNELVARIHAMLRRPRQQHANGVRSFGELTIDPDGRTVTLNGELVELTRTEFDLLETLSAQPRIVISRTQLLERVWGSVEYRDSHVVAVHIANLRRKLGDASAEPQYVQTVRGVGYRMRAP